MNTILLRLLIWDKSLFIKQLLKKKINILNHIAYETKNFSKDIRRLIKSGYRPIIKPTKAKAFKGKKVIFLSISMDFGTPNIFQFPIKYFIICLNIKFNL